MSNISITNIIRTILLNNADIAAKILNSDGSYSLFPLFAPDGTAGDFILYKRDEFGLERSKMGISQEICKIIINVDCANYDDSQALAELVYQTLEHQFTSPAHIKVELTDSAEDIDTIKDTSGTAVVRYVQIMYFSIKNLN
jgi:hypothetical protein